MVASGVGPDTLNLLAKYVGSIQMPSQQNMARQILLRSQIDWSVPNFAKPGSGGGGKSVVSRIFDVLSRPNYAAASLLTPVLEDIAQHHWHQAFTDINVYNPTNPEPIKRLMSGFTGKNKATFTEAFLNDPILQQTNLGKQSKVQRAIEGLVFDIALDPTTYVGPGIVKGGAKALRLGKLMNKIRPAVTVPSKAEGAISAAGHVAETERQAGRAAELMSAVSRATGAVPEGAVAIPKVAAPKMGAVSWAADALRGLRTASSVAGGKIPKSLPGDVKLVGKSGKAIRGRYGVDFANYMKNAQHIARVGRQPGFYGQVQRAEQMLSRIAKSDPQALIRMAPKAPVEGVKANKAETAIATTVARMATRQLKIGRDKFLNPKQALTIFNSVLRKTSGEPAYRMYRATAMMRAAEKYLESQGYGFKWWDGTGVRLTTIIDELGSPNKLAPDIMREIETGKVTHPALDQAVEVARTRSAMSDSKFVQLAMDQSTDAMARAAGTMTPARTEQMSKVISDQIKRGLQGARVSPAAQRTGSELFRNVLGSQTLPVQRAMSMTQQVAHDIMNAKASKEAMVSRADKISRAVERHMGSPYRVVSTKLGDANRAVEFLGERFATHYGQSLIRPISQDYMLSAIANAAKRAQVWSGVVRATTREARTAALRDAQRMSWPGHLPNPAADPRLAGLFRDSMERLFSSTGIRDTAQSVATRAAFTMEDLNAELRRVGEKFQFTKGKVEDELGAIHDYSKGVDWLKSWETHAVTGEAVEFLSKMEQATERLSRKYAFMDEVAARFANTRRGGPFQHLAADPRLAGQFFPKDIVVQVNRAMDMMKNAYQPTNSFIKFVDKVTSAWKSGVTIYAPSFHIRNLIGDTWLSWVNGVNNPRVYKAAGSILRSQAGRYRDSIAAVEDLVTAGSDLRSVDRPGKIVARTRNGRKLTAETVYKAAFQRGLLLGARALEDLDPDAVKFIRPFGGKVQKVFQTATELREHYVRLAHFVDRIQKSKAGTLKEIFDEAAHEVRRVHPDGMDLTNFERKYMRRLFPFYSWMRKSMPLILESIVTRPGKVVIPAKVNEAIQGAVGIDAPSRTDPFPTDQLFPNWMKEKGIGPIARTGMSGIPGLIANLSRQGPGGGYTIMNPSNPMIDMFAQFGGMGNPRAPLQGAASALNPLARIPIEVTTGRQIFTDVPIGYDPNRYITEQFPGGAIASRLTNMGIFGPTNRGEKEGLGNKEAIVNFLTAAGIQGSGPYIKQAEFEQKGRTAAQRKKEMQRIMKQYGLTQYRSGQIQGG